MKTLGLPSLEYRRERSDIIQVYKIMHGIGKVDEDKFFKVNRYSATRGHSLKLLKKGRAYSAFQIELWTAGIL